MLALDGSQGEGGGQILRTALACSLLTGVPFSIEKIRAARHRPGLLPQHLAAVRAAAEIADAATEEAILGSETLTFEPGEVRAGEYHFDIGTAGSTGLVLQTVLVPLLSADGESRLVIEGGTHNEGAPPFEFLDLSFTPLLRRMGAELTLFLEKPGFYPVGGGRIRALVGNATWRRLDLLERGAIRSVWARSLVSRLPLSIAHRELAVVEKGLDWPKESLTAEAIDADGPGNALILVVESERVTEVFTGFGRRGLPAEEVASRTVAKTRRYLDSGVAVGLHLADQLLVPLTQSKGGSFLTSEPSTHFATNADVIDRFFDLKITTRPMGENLVVDCRVE
ncbi:MAG TPA: RNA 3'-terminal phosphate cyclase [Acidimicrobiia bacterium]